MPCGVFCWSHNLKVLQPIVALIAVLVMYQFKAAQSSTQMLLHQPAMFVHPARDTCRRLSLAGARVATLGYFWNATAPLHRPVPVSGARARVKSRNRSR
jgi:hypothetical protein